MTTDLSSTIIAKSDQLNSDDLIAGPITVEITRVSVSVGGEQPTSIYYKGDNGKPYKPGKSMCRVLVEAWGKEGADYVGRFLTLYRDPDIRFGPMAVGGVRISHMSHIKGELQIPLAVKKGSKKLFTVKPLATPAKTPAQNQENSAQSQANTGQSPPEQPAKSDYMVYTQAGKVLRVCTSIGEFMAWHKTNISSAKIDTVEKLDGFKEANAEVYKDLAEKGYDFEIKEIEQQFFDVREELNQPS